MGFAYTSLVHFSSNINGVTISPEKIILQREKEHCAIFIHTLYVGFTGWLRLSWGVRVRVVVRIR